MIIKDNEFTKLNTSYFKSFTPYSLPNGIEGTDQIANMVSYSIIPSLNGVNLDYNIGAVDNFNFVLSVKNLTTNVSLDITVESENYFNISPRNFVLGPEQINNISINVDNSVINEYGKALQFLTQITLVVKNIKNGTFAQRRIGVEGLQQVFLPDNVDII